MGHLSPKHSHLSCPGEPLKSIRRQMFCCQAQQRPRGTCLLTPLLVSAWVAQQHDKGFKKLTLPRHSLGLLLLQHTDWQHCCSWDATFPHFLVLQEMDFSSWWNFNVTKGRGTAVVLGGFFFWTSPCTRLPVVRHSPCSWTCLCMTNHSDQK